MSVGKTETGKKTKRKRKRMSIDGYPVLEPNAGGIDVGAREIYVSVPPDEESVRIFATFAEDLERMADWLIRVGVTTVAMESTGVYWIPVFEILEQRGIRPCWIQFLRRGWLRDQPNAAKLPYPRRRGG